MIQTPSVMVDITNCPSAWTSRLRPKRFSCSYEEEFETDARTFFDRNLPSLLDVLNRCPPKQYAHPSYPKIVINSPCAIRNDDDAFQGLEDIFLPSLDWKEPLRLAKPLEDHDKTRMAPGIDAKPKRISASRNKECSVPLCPNSARSRGLCKRHGGGKRCTFFQCTKSDQGGGFCIAHGGGGSF